MLVRRGVLFLVCVLLCTAAIKEKVTRNVVVTAEEEKIRDAAGYAAIAEIHREMDDDRSGSIDRKETSGFMTEDMHMRSSDRLRRENVFHGTDDAITVDDLWEAWFESEERAWTNEQVLYWVVHVINLPMYADMITKTKVDGKILPRLAVHNSTSYMSQELGIKSSVHRQKLRLNALDVVLFGFRETYSKTKDIALAFLLLLLTSVIILYARQRQRARLQVTELSSRLTQLKSMECEFEDVQKKWNEERNKRSTSDGGVNNGEIENLRIQLEEAERRLEEGGSGGNTPLALQPLLRRTCESEMAFMEKQRQECFIEMKEAIEMVNRLQKKQGSVLSSLKLATGASTASDQVDSKIFVIKSRMEKIHALSRDTQERWMQIESLCGFPILYMNETTAGGVYHTQATSHYYNTNSGSSSVSSMSLGNGNGSVHATNSTTTAMRTTTPVVVQQKVAAFQSARDTDAAVFAAADAARVPVVRMVPVVHSESAPALAAEDSQSLNSIETKKRRGFMKLNIFKKSPSKASMLSNGVASSNGNGH